MSLRFEYNSINVGTFLFVFLVYLFVWWGSRLLVLKGSMLVRWWSGCFFLTFLACFIVLLVFHYFLFLFVFTIAFDRTLPIIWRIHIVFSPHCTGRNEGFFYLLCFYFFHSFSVSNSLLSFSSFIPFPLFPYSFFLHSFFYSSSLFFALSLFSSPISIPLLFHYFCSLFLFFYTT